MNRNNLNGKNKTISFFQNFGISFVVIGHAMENLGPLPSFMAYLHQWIYSFHMPLFMFVAGYLSLQGNFYQENASFSHFLKKRASRLLIPYIIISAIVFILKSSLLNKWALHPTATGFPSFFDGIFYPMKNPIGSFWFLPTLFLISILTFLIHYKLLRDNKIAIIAFTLICLIVNITGLFRDITFLNISGIMYYYIFYWLGILFAQYHQYFKELTERYNASVMFILFFLISHFLNLIFHQYGGSNLLNAISGILMAIFLGKLCVKNNVGFLGIIDGYYYQIYLLSYFFHHMTRILFYEKFSLPFYFNFSFSFMTGLLGPILITKLVDTYAYRLNPILGIRKPRWALP